MDKETIIWARREKLVLTLRDRLPLIALSALESMMALSEFLIMCSLVLFDNFQLISPEIIFVSWLLQNISKYNCLKNSFSHSDT